jgi:hypothetical protein
LELVVEIRGPDGSYGPLGESSDAELILGFQGFRYVYLRGRVAHEPPSPSGAVRVELEGQPARSQPFGDLGFTDEGDGLVTQPLRVFFNDDPLPSLIDARCELTLYVGGASCGAHAGGAALLRYDPACYEGPDGARVCPDGGIAPDGGAGPDGAP